MLDHLHKTIADMEAEASSVNEAERAELKAALAQLESSIAEQQGELSARLLEAKQAYKASRCAELQSELSNLLRTKLSKAQAL